VITKNGKSISVEPQSFVLKQPTTPLIATLFRVLEDDLNNRKQLINAIIDTEINERKRFAKDLHDGLGPLLSAVKLYVSELKATKIKAKEREDLVKIITELVDEAIQNARETANSLMPTVIRNYGLISAVQSFITKINYLNKQKINFTVEPAVFTLDNALETSLYRIIKELVNNTLKHANAKNIDIALIFKDNVLSLDFSDDGVGFDFEQIQKSQASGLGLNNMINRVHLLNGKINFNTSKGNGFKLHIVIELDKMFVSKT
jgi:signal transduction histidine kinase